MMARATGATTLTSDCDAPIDLSNYDIIDNAAKCDISAEYDENDGINNGPVYSAFPPVSLPVRPSPPNESSDDKEVLDSTVFVAKGLGPKSQQLCLHIDQNTLNGNITVIVDVCVTTFADRYLIIISDNRAVQIWVDACIEKAEEHLFDIRILFGDRTQDYPLFMARDLIAHINYKSQKALLLGTSLKTPDRKVLLSILGEIRRRISFTQTA